MRKQTCRAEGCCHFLEVDHIFPCTSPPNSPNTHTNTHTRTSFVKPLDTTRNIFCYLPAPSSRNLFYYRKNLFFLPTTRPRPGRKREVLPACEDILSSSSVATSPVVITPASALGMNSQVLAAFPVCDGVEDEKQAGWRVRDEAGGDAESVSHTLIAHRVRLCFVPLRSCFPWRVRCRRPFDAADVLFTVTDSIDDAT